MRGDYVARCDEAETAAEAMKITAKD